MALTENLLYPLPAPDRLPADTLLVRHAATDREPGRLDGLEDLPLNEIGKLQADDLGLFLCKQGLDLVIYSPMLRAKQTAHIAGEHLMVPMFEEDGLCELNWGPANAGRLQAEVFPPDVEERLEQEGIFGTVNGSESYASAYGRVIMTLEKYAGARVAAFGHGTTHKAALNIPRGLSRTGIRTFPFGNTEVIRFAPHAPGEPQRLHQPRYK